jgi:hypothetical protein
MAKYTRRARRTSRRATRGMTVESLHASFEKIDAKARALVERGVTDTELGHGIEAAWSSQFHSDLSSAAVRGMVAHYRGMFKGGKRKTRRAQRGGMAPVGWTMGPGTTAAIYGRFPVEMGSSASAVASLDRFYESQISRACDSTGGYPAPGLTDAKPQPQTGGGFFDSLLNGYAPASVPRNVVEMTASAIQGAPIRNPPADPVVSRAPLASYAPTPFNPQPISQISSMAPIYQPL